MKLLLDENLSPALAAILAEFYEDIRHVRDIDLKSAPDPVLWTYASREGYTIVTKDADFHHRSFLYGHPPRVIWIRLGNCSTKDIAALSAGTTRRSTGFINLRDHRSSFWPDKRWYAHLRCPDRLRNNLRTGTNSPAIYRPKNGRAVRPHKIEAQLRSE